MTAVVWAWDVSGGQGISFNVVAPGHEFQEGVARDELIALVRRNRAVLLLNVLQGGNLSEGDYASLPGQPRMGGTEVRCATEGCHFEGITFTWDPKYPPLCPSCGARLSLALAGS